jgi:hypothetical protein
MMTALVSIRYSDEGYPSLEALVEQAGRRHAASIGETYVEDSFKRPAHQGGWQHVTEAEWCSWAHAVTRWRQDLRTRLEFEREISRRRRRTP